MKSAERKGRDAYDQDIAEAKRDTHGQDTDVEENESLDKETRNENHETETREKRHNVHREKIDSLFTLDVLYKITGIVSAFGVLLALITLATTLYPQIVWGNQNHVNRANAGDAYSQMFLAEHYYEIGEYNDSIYWYKLASVNTQNSDYQAVACNNLGFLYAKGYGLSDYELEGIHRYAKAILLFAKAHEIDKGGSIALKSELNGIETLRYYWDECYYLDEDECSDTIVSWKDRAANLRIVTSSEYKSFEICRGVTFQEGNTYYTLCGTYVGLSENGYYTRTYYMYYGKTYEDNADPYEPEFIYLQDIV